MCKLMPLYVFANKIKIMYLVFLVGHLPLFSVIINNSAWNKSPGTYLRWSSEVLIMGVS